jgi:hypothetical protein
MPKVSITICKQCAKIKKCTDYNLFQQPLLFPDISKEEFYTKKRKRRLKSPENTQTPSHEEQLAMNFMPGK